MRNDPVMFAREFYADGQHRLGSPARNAWRDYLQQRVHQVYAGPLAQRATDALRYFDNAHRVPGADVTHAWIDETEALPGGWLEANGMPGYAYRSAVRFEPEIPGKFRDPTDRVLTHFDK